jgi:O-succinylbenzoic acid--CoA ligase
VLPAPIDPARTLAILPTSGTTGPPRAAILSRRAFLASAAASARNLPLGRGDRWLLCMPIAHVGGLSILVRCLVARATLAVAGPFETRRTIDAIARARPTHLSLVPTMLGRLLDAGWMPPPELRAILLGGAACPPRLLARAIEAGLPIRTTYGLTEACSQVTTARSVVRSPEDGSGEPLPGIDVRIGAGGTIQVRGPTLFDGYFGETEPPLTPDGFFDTGDFGEFDARGRLHVLGRRSDLIVTGGENVYPAEVEAALERIVGVRAACVFGVPDEHWGQIVAAALVVEPGAPDDTEIRERLRAELASFKIPRRFARLPELALTASGKLDRTATARLAASILECQGSGAHGASGESP